MVKRKTKGTSAGWNHVGLALSGVSGEPSISGTIFDPGMEILVVVLGCLESFSLRPPTG